MRNLDGMQNERGTPKIAGAIFKAWMQARAEKRRRAFEEHRDAVRMAHEERMQEKRILARMEEARENRRFQEKLAADEARNQLKIALFNAKVQRELSEINAENQKQLALFQAEVQREIAKFNAENQLNLSVNTAELRYNLENFPLYIRSWSSKKSLQKAGYLPVKVVVIPPDEDSGKWEKFLTSQITYFMQKNIPDTYYEFLGGAWRGGRCTGQTAYNLIYEEFHEEPFLILDCDYMEQSRFSMRICFWYPGSLGIQVWQFINDLDLRSILNLSSDCRDDSSIEDVYQHECMRLCSDICKLLIGMIVDMYQLSVGTSQDSEMLKVLPDIVKDISGRLPEAVCRNLVLGMLGEYESLAWEEFALPPRTRLHCICELANTFYDLRRSGVMKIPGSRKKAEDYVKIAWEQWCRLMGISVEELGSILRSETDAGTLCAMVSEESDSRRELEEIYNLYDKINNGNDKLVSLIQKIRISEEVHD